MSYQSISIKEVINKINATYGGWFLPAVQRPYVWGSRYESEFYICKLFDSLLRGYPIGGLLLWSTKENIPYREFINDYEDGEIVKIVDKGLWEREDKSLVYDDQQRLQTLYSCLKYTFNGKVLVFDLLFDMDDEELELDETGFSFVEKQSPIRVSYIRLNELFSKKPEEKFKFRKEILRNLNGISDDESIRVENNIDNLWKVFVEMDKKSLAYFPISQVDESIVNEIFQRLNMTGVTLSLADSLFTRIKEYYPTFEEKLQLFSRDVYNKTSNGYQFDSYSILQLLHLLIVGRVRVDPKKIDTKTELKEFNKIWRDLKAPLREFLCDFMWVEFKINHNSVIPKKLALLPMAVYFYLLREKGIKYRDFSQDDVLKLKQYFILSQINDWRLQSIVDNFTRILKRNTKKTNKFPLDEFISSLEESKKRNTELYEVNFTDYKWFSLKIMSPNRLFQFDPDVRGRFNPEIDHIFPQRMIKKNKSLEKQIDSIWNMQPIKWEVNNLKLGKFPKEFFSSREGKKYLDHYDFLPTLDLNDKIWDDPKEFIKIRREIMVNYFKEKYQLELK